MSMLDIAAAFCSADEYLRAVSLIDEVFANPLHKLSAGCKIELALSLFASGLLPLTAAERADIRELAAERMTTIMQRMPGGLPPAAGDVGGLTFPPARHH